MSEYISTFRYSLIAEEASSTLTVHGVHHEANLLRVSGAREVRVDLLRLLLVERHKSVKNIVASRAILRTPCAWTLYQHANQRSNGGAARCRFPHLRNRGSNFSSG